MKPAAATSTYRVDFAPERPPRPAYASKGRVLRVARLLALAHRIDGMINAGELLDLAHAARLCGVTRARMTYLANLTLLAPAIQEEVLDLPSVTKGRDPISERSLRPIAAEPDWNKQMRMWRKNR